MHLIKKLTVSCLVLLVVVHTHGQNHQFANKVYEYKPAPGQFINTSLGSPEAAKSLIGEKNGGVSLGAFGGYIILGFENPIENNNDNPYGIDFTIFGNANQSSSEPGLVYVMHDENNNGLPDDTWYLLAGSDYWFNSSVKDYEVTYFNPGDTLAKDINWEDNIGNSGIIPANEFHSQTYYPINDSFPDISITNYVLKGAKIIDRIDRTMADYIVTKTVPFGFADNLPRNNNYSGLEPDNPYTNAVEGMGADGFDINWAIDSNDNYVELTQIDFIKIQTGVNALAGWLGEISTEVLDIVDIEPNSTLSGEEKLLVIEPISSECVTGDKIQLSGYTFFAGQLQKNVPINWKSTNNDVATINESGLIEAVNEGWCYIKAEWEGYPLISDSLKIKVYLPNDVEESYLNAFQVFPNPVTNILYLNRNIGFTHYVIYDCYGNILINSELTEDGIVFNKLLSGIYFIEFKGKGIREYKKVIKK